MSKIITKEEYIKLDQIAINKLLEENEALVISDKILFQKGFYWCKFRKEIFQTTKEKEEKIHLSHTHLKILELLVNKKDEIVSVDDISAFAWDLKYPSIFTLRNMIKQIRDKTFYDIIVSKSGRGYKLGGLLI